MIGTFSRASRRHLLRLLQSLDQRQLVGLPLFVTLTYPDTWPDNPTVWKTQLDTLSKRLARRYPQMIAIWKLEAQQRGAPHYHLIVFNVRFIDYQWLAQAWFEIVGSGNPKHLQAGTEVRRVKSWRGVMSYAAKYVAKPNEQLPAGWPAHVGRWWGVLGRGKLPQVWHEQTMSFHEFYQVRRILRRYLRSRGVQMGVGLFTGMSVFLSANTGMRLLQATGVMR